MSHGDYRYRIRLRFWGFEPQMRFVAGLSGKAFWTPLLPSGFWAEPESVSFGGVINEYPVSLGEAIVAIRNAKRINAR